MPEISPNYGVEMELTDALKEAARKGADELVLVRDVLPGRPRLLLAVTDTVRNFSRSIETSHEVNSDIPLAILSMTEIMLYSFLLGVKTPEGRRDATEVVQSLLGLVGTELGVAMQAAFPEDAS